MKKLLLPLLLLTTLCSCSKNNFLIQDKVFCFDTMVDIRLYEGEKDNMNYIKDIVNDYSKMSDNYLESDLVSVTTINASMEPIEVDGRLYKLLKEAQDLSDDISTFDYRCGELSKTWKQAIENEVLPSDSKIEELLDRMNDTSLTFLGDNKVKKSGPGEFDLGGIAKGYALDAVKEYLDEQEIKSYLISGGDSSVLLGEKKSKDGYFNVGVSKTNKDMYLKLKNCFASTSAIDEQYVEIDGKIYSHIVNPVNGSAISKHDKVIVISNKGYIGDALSTSMMMMSIDEIKEYEMDYNVKTIVFDGSSVAYKHSDIEVYYQ